MMALSSLQHARTAMSVVEGKESASFTASNSRVLYPRKNVNLWLLRLVFLVVVLNAVMLTTSRSMFVATEDDPATAQERQQQHPPRILYTTHPNATYNETYNLYYRCAGHDRAPLPPPIHAALHFTTSVQLNNLKILVMGDSVGIQFSQILEESFAMGHAGQQHQHKVLQYSWGTHEGIHVGTAFNNNKNTVSAVAGWRILGLLLRAGVRKSLPNSPGGGWRQEQVQQLLQYRPILSMEQEDHSSSNVTTATATTTVSADTNTSSTPLSSFDVVVYRIPHGWMQLDTITLKSVRETVELAHELLGATTVIFTTVPFSNNIQSETQREQMDATNAMLAGFAADWPVTREDSPVKHVLLLRLDRFVDDLILANGRALGMITDNDTSSSSKLLHHLLQRRCCTVKKFHRPVAHICGAAANVTEKTKTCQQNSWSLDGMHFCLQAVGGRVVAGLACLIGCAYNNSGQDDDDTVDVCQRRCNAQFMSLQPIPHHGEQAA